MYVGVSWLKIIYTNYLILEDFLEHKRTYQIILIFFKTGRPINVIKFVIAGKSLTKS